MPTARSALPAPLPGCTPLFDAAAMRDADLRAERDHHLPTILLMEQAGRRTAEAILTRWAQVRSAVILVGSGNNGGDGMVIARHLFEAGWDVRVRSATGTAPAEGDAGLMSRIAASLGLTCEAFSASDLPPDAVLVDALLGTGSTGAPRESILPLVEAAVAHGGPVVAVDLPTGVDSDTGEVAGDAVRADLTCTYHGDKLGLHVAPGLHHAGEVMVLDIGAPVPVPSTPVAWLAGEETLAAMPGKSAGGDKYRAGAVLTIAGSQGMVGAGVLASRAALRAGAGLVVAAAPAEVQPQMATMMPEVMVAPIPDEAGKLDAASVDETVRQAARVGAVVLGPGLGRSTATTGAVQAMLHRIGHPTVVDADALWHLAELRPDAVDLGHAVLTPHSGEAARLLGRERAWVDASRCEAARDIARRWGAVTVLKGAGTLVASPSGAMVVASGSEPRLATAGSGDVLSGVIGAFLASGMPSFEAAVVGVVLHAAAARRSPFGAGTTALDLVDGVGGVRGVLDT
ncbi:MAG: NAD(P)H-hydrate dehydratase [Thermoleophilia bacterium]|nr:NAD(P)H-hydrate dehydratase [Thermoleophilia bacterium]